MTNDLYLKHIFTDRAGREVYTIHETYTEDLYQSPVIGQIRMHPQTEDNVLVDWVQCAGEDDE